MNKAIEIDDTYLRAFCAKWKVQEIAIFGSALRDDFGPQSDLDFLVSFSDNAESDLFDLMAMRDVLATYFERSVDLVEKEALRNPWRKREILSTCEVLYAA